MVDMQMGAEYGVDAVKGGKPGGRHGLQESTFPVIPGRHRAAFLSLPRPVSTTIRREGVSTTSEWIDILSASLVAKWGISQGNFRISSLVARGRITGCCRPSPVRTTL